VPRPLKPFLVGYKDIENRVARAIEVRLDLETGILDHAAIKHWDEVLLATEARDIMGGESAGKWALHAAPMAEEIAPWSHALAERMFLARFRVLTEGQRP
jgi:hypothetical protein